MTEEIILLIIREVTILLWIVIHYVVIVEQDMISVVTVLLQKSETPYFLNILTV